MKIGTFGGGLLLAGATWVALSLTHAPEQTRTPAQPLVSLLVTQMGDVSHLCPSERNVLFPLPATSEVAVCHELKYRECSFVIIGVYSNKEDAESERNPSERVVMEFEPGGLNDFAFERL